MLGSIGNDGLGKMCYVTGVWDWGGFGERHVTVNRICHLPAAPTG